MVTRVTKKEQEAMGYKTPQEFSTALTNFENSKIDRNINNVFTPESLQDVPAFNIETPTVQADPIVSDLSRFETNATRNQDLFTKDLEAKAKQSEGTESRSFEELMRSALELPTEAALTDEAYSVKGGVDDIQKELDGINSEILAEQQALRRQVEQIQSGGGVATAAQRNVAVQEAQRQSYRKQADLSVIQMAVQGRYDTAKSIADRAVDVEFQREKKNLDIMETIYNRNKELFDKDEQRLFETKQRDRERSIEDAKDEKKKIYDLAIKASENGADRNIVQSILSTGNSKDALSRASQFLVDPLERAVKSQQLANAQLDNLIKRAEIGDEEALKKLNLTPSTEGKVTLKPKEVATIQKEIVSNDAYKSLQESINSITALKEYEKVFNEVGTTSGVTSPFENERLNAVYNTATLNLKEFFNLGVLNGPDLEIIQGVLGKPTNQGFITNIAAKSGAEAGLDNMYTQIEQTVDDRYLSLISQYGQYDPSQVGTLNDINRSYLQAKAQLDPEVARFLQENPDMPVEDAVRVINTNL